MKQPRVPFFALVVAACTAINCVNVVAERDSATVVHAPTAAAPLIGAQVGDSADRSCQVVLRDIGRVIAADDFAVHDGRYVFEGRVDVSSTALAEGAAVRLLVGTGGAWRELEPVASVDIAAGFTRVLFHFDDDVLHGVLPGPDMAATMDVIPFIALGAARQFDHNVLVDAAASYTLSAANGYTVATPTHACPPDDAPTLSFHADWTESQAGSIVAGRSVVIDYDIARNSECRQTYNGAPTWNVSALATFLPMQTVQEVSVVDHRGDASRPLLARIFAPEGATELVLYFRNTDRAGCSRYDSDFGRNYRYAVAPSKASTGPRWVGEDVAVMSRAASKRCEGARAFGSQLVFGSWPRQRAAITDLCFEAWEPGVTDFDNPDLWKQLDVQAHHRFSPDAPFATTPVVLAGRKGNNAQYAFDLRAFDPFQWGRCPGAVPTTRVPSPSGDLEQATLEVYFTVNAKELRPTDSDVYRIVYEDAADSPRTPCGP